MKRGQITLFIIIAILIITVIGLGIYFKDSINQEKTEAEIIERAIVAPEVQNIYNHIFDCVEESAKEGLILIGLQGGYMEAPLDSIPIEDEGISITIGYDKGENKLPPLMKMQEEIESYINTFSPSCVNLQLFEGFSFEEGIPKTKTKILENNIIFEVDYPVIAKKGDTIYKLDKTLKFSYPIRLKKIYEISQNIIKNEATNLNLNFLLDLGIDIDILSFEENQVVYLLTDDESKIDGIPYIFMFANRYAQ